MCSSPMFWAIPVVGGHDRTRHELRVTATSGDVLLTTPAGTYLIPESSDAPWQEAVVSARRVARQQAERGGF